MGVEAVGCSSEIGARALPKHFSQIELVAGLLGLVTTLAITFNDPLTLHRLVLLLWITLVGGALIQERRQARRWQRELARSLQRTIDMIPQMVWTWDGSGPIRYNRQWEEFTGVTFRSEPDFDVLRLIHGDDQPLVEIEWATFLEEGEPFDFEYRLKHRSGEYRWVLARAVPDRDAGGALVGWYGTCTDVHDRVSAQRALVDSVGQLKWASEHDGLTSLLNRQALQAELDFVRRRLEDGKQVGLLLLDLDHFKHINDSLGHAAGDELLRGAAERLKASVRASDVVARLGGDEFAILIKGISSPGELAVTAEGILARLRSPIVLAGRSATIGTSIGGALYPADAASTEELFKCADAALYRSKQNGRGGVVLFKREMLEKAKCAAAQLELARSVVARELITPVYQPKVELSTGACAGFEALLRWKGSETLELPETLGEAFRDYELAAEMAEIMHRQVATDLRSWLDRGLDVGRVSINASPAEFLRDDYAERLLRLLQQVGVPATRIEVEITEQALFDRGTDYVDRALGVLKQAGVTVSLDDFGTGYSSLAHLRDFPVDEVKIDRSFIQQMCEIAELAEIVSAVVNLARSLRLEVVAEGIETQGQADLLRAMGCRFAQGHLFGEAAEAALVPASLSRHRIAA